MSNFIRSEEKPFRTPNSKQLLNDFMSFKPFYIKTNEISHLRFRKNTQEERHNLNLDGIDGFKPPWKVKELKSQKYLLHLNNLGLINQTQKYWSIQ